MVARGRQAGRKPVQVGGADQAIEPRAADQLFGAVAGKALGLRIEAGENALGVHGHDRRARRREQRALEHVAFDQRGAHLFVARQLFIEFGFVLAHVVAHHQEGVHDVPEFARGRVARHALVVVPAHLLGQRGQ